MLKERKIVPGVRLPEQRRRAHRAESSRVQDASWRVAVGCVLLLACSGAWGLIT